MINEKKFVQMSDGTKIHSEICESSQHVWIIATHGIGEHLERHDYLMKNFSADFNIFMYDLRGHGKSEGKRAYIDDFNQYLNDLDEIISFLKENFKMKRFILFGHSMGALITASYVQNMLKSDFYPEVIFLSGPPVGVSGVLGKIVDFMPLELVSYLGDLPSIPIKGLVNLNYLSHDPRVKEAYLKDELNCTHLHTKLLLALIKMSKQVFSKEIDPHCKAFCAYGSGDQVVSVPSLRNYFKEIETKFELLEIEGGYHELHLEIVRYRKVYFKFLKDSFMTVYND